MAKESGDMDPFSEKHPLSDDERCESPRTTDKKKLRRLSRELMDVNIAKTWTLCEDQDSQSMSRAEMFTNSSLPGTFSSGFTQGARPKEYGAMFSQLLEPKEIFTSRFGHGARPKEYRAIPPKPLEPKGEHELEASYRQFLEQKGCPTIENFEQVEQRLQSTVQSLKERQRDSCSRLSPSINHPSGQDYNSDENAISNISGKFGVWKVEVARCLTLENCKQIAFYKGFYPEISYKIGDANLGLEVLEIMEKKDLIGPDGQDLYNTLFNLNLSAAAETLQRCVPKQLTPLDFQRLIFGFTLAKGQHLVNV